MKRNYLMSVLVLSIALTSSSLFFAAGAGAQANTDSGVAAKGFSVGLGNAVLSKVGDEAGGFKVESYDKDSGIITLTKGDMTVRVKDGVNISNFSLASDGSYSMKAGKVELKGLNGKELSIIGNNIVVGNTSIVINTANPVVIEQSASGLNMKYGETAVSYKADNSGKNSVILSDGKVAVNSVVISGTDGKGTVNIASTSNGVVVANNGNTLNTNQQKTKVEVALSSESGNSKMTVTAGTTVFAMNSNGENSNITTLSAEGITVDEGSALDNTGESVDGAKIETETAAGEKETSSAQQPAEETAGGSEETNAFDDLINPGSETTDTETDRSTEIISPSRF